MKQKAQQLQEWFSTGKDYAAGVILFEKYGMKGHRNLLRIFSKGPTKEYTIPKLERELWEVLQRENHPLSPLKGGNPRAEPEVSETPKRIVNIVVEQKSKSSYTLENAPQVIIDADREWRLLYKESGALREAIRNVNNVFANHDRAKLIMEKELRVRELQAIVDDWRETGKVQEVEIASPDAGLAMTVPTEIDVNDKVAVMRRIGNLRSNISKRKDKGDTVRVEAFTKELNYLLTFVQ